MVRQALQTVMVCGFLGMAILYGCAADPWNAYKGSLESGVVRTGSLDSDDLWVFYGEQGDRVVICGAVDSGGTPPGIYLYPPDGGDFIACSEGECECWRVIDHELKAPGTYTVLIHHGDPQRSGDYKVALAKLTMEGSYRIEPDDPDGNLIHSDSILGEEKIRGVDVAAVAGPYVCTPYLVAPIMVGVVSGAGMIGRMLGLQGKSAPRGIVPPERNRNKMVVGGAR